MTTMQKAHEIRRQAATKWSCKISEIDWSTCLKMAHAGEELNFQKDKKESVTVTGTPKQNKWAISIVRRWLEILKNHDEDRPERIKMIGKSIEVLTSENLDSQLIIASRLEKRVGRIISATGLLTGDRKTSEYLMFG